MADGAASGAPVGAGEVGEPVPGRGPREVVLGDLAVLDLGQRGGLDRGQVRAQRLARGDRVRRSPRASSRPTGLRRRGEPRVRRAPPGGPLDEYARAFHDPTPPATSRHPEPGRQRQRRQFVKTFERCADAAWSPLRQPAADRLGDGAQPGAGDVGDGGEPGVAGVGARAGRLGGVDGDAAAGAAVLRRSASATAWPVVPLPAKKSSTRASSGMVWQDPAEQPGRLGRLEDVADDLLELGDGGVGGADLLGQPDRAQLLAAPVGCSQSFWNTSTRSPAPPLTRRHTRSSGRWSISGRLHRQTAGPAVAEDRTDLLRALEGAVAHAPGLRVAPDGEVQGARGGGVELLVGVAQRQVPVAAAVAARSAGSRARRPCRRCSRRARCGGRRARRRGGTRGRSRSPCRAGGPWR